jgi:serine/threonine protein kinase
MQKHFHHYYLTKQLTSKPLRSTYLAHHINDPLEQVVIKIFDATCLNLEQDSESLLQKIESIKKLKHTHIVPIRDFGIEQGHPYVVSTYLPNGSLRHRLDHLPSQSLDLQEALPIVLQVGRALRYAHQHKILHGNIKPENIFFNEQGKILIGDFHILDCIETKLDKSDPHTACLAPEQFDGTISEKSDQYALASLAYELIMGHTPFSVQGSSSMWTKQNAQSTIALPDFIPHLPEQAEEVILKAMAKDPSERYANISIFMRALEAVSVLPISVSSSSPIEAVTSDTPAKTTREPVANVSTVAPIVARLVEPPEQVKNGPNTNKTLDIPSSRTSHRPSSRTSHRPSSRTSHRPSSKVTDTPASKILDTPTSKTLDTPASKILDTPTSKTLDTPASKILGTPPSKTLDISSSRVLDTSSRKALVRLADDTLSKGGLPQPHKPLTPTLWVAFALSGIIILMGTVMLYVFVPPHSPGSSNSEKSSSKTPMTNLNNRLTPTIASGQSGPPFMSTPLNIEAHLTSSYAEQTSNVYNLTNEGTLDWIEWGLNAPGDVNHKLAVQQQISNFTPIGTARVQRDDHYTNSYTWSDGTPVMVAPPQQPSGVYVRGVGNGFTLTVAASTTPRTLRVYVGAVHAEGYLWAGIDGRTITDTSLDMRNNPNIEDNGIYTLTFSSSIPGQVLTVKYTVKASDTNNGYVMLEAATLQD